jgi:hypothetical protein
MPLKLRMEGYGTSNWKKSTKGVDGKRQNTQRQIFKDTRE